MSRGTETIDTVLVTGSNEATIIVSVRAVLRPTPESMPNSRTLIRWGPPLGEAEGRTDGSTDGGAVAKSLGSGAMEPLGVQLPVPASTTKTSSDAMRASLVM